MAYRYGDRIQRTPLPPSVDEYVSKDAPAKACDIIIDSLDFDQLGIEIAPHLLSADSRLISAGFNHPLFPERRGNPAWLS